MTRLRFLRNALLACGLVVCAASVQAQQYDPSYGDSQSYDQSQPADTDQAPGRVARLAYSTGQVQFAPSGESDWGSVDVNRPMVIGDRLLTGDDGRAVLELGDASVRIDNDSAFDFLNLDESNVQIELSQGTLNLAVRQLDQGENFEVDTPTVAFVAATPGVYRIDNAPNGTGSMVTVFQGSGTVYGQNGASRNVQAGQSYRFDDSTLANVDVTGLPQADDFDRFCESRDQNYRRYADQQQYVPQDMIGGDDLDQYGSWNQVPDYGNVWYPTSVPSGWAPYRDGHWAWIEPWGWTWVDNQRWGFAPFHYGRWAYIGNRWGWMPGPVNVRPVYAPALVAFIGGSGLSVSINLGGGGGPVGWFPLGPRDVYVPWFHASRNYFTNVNVTNIRNVYVNRTVINNFYGDYQSGRAPRYNGHDYAYRNMPSAVTAVPRNVFTGSRPVRSAALQLDRNQLARAEVAMRPGVTPDRSSLGIRQPTARPAVLKNREAFQRPVVARHAPPPRPVSFAAREKVIASQHGQPLTPAQLQTLRQQRPASASNSTRVKLVPVAAGAAAYGAARAAQAGRPTPAREQPAVAPTQAPRPFHNQIHPIPARNTEPPVRPGEMPSARFRQPAQPAAQPRATVIRPAGEPAQRPQPTTESPRAASSFDARAAQQRQAQVQAQEQAQQRIRAQQDQQRQAQLQGEQRARAQAAQERAAQQQRDAQAQQQRQAQMQQQREAQMEQQRQAQMQQQREAQMEQQRQAQMQQQREAQQQQQREVQMQQRAAQMQQQRQMQMQQREQQRPQPSERQESDHRDSGHRRPPPSSDNGNR